MLVKGFQVGWYTCSDFSYSYPVIKSCGLVGVFIYVCRTGFVFYEFMEKNVIEHIMYERAFAFEQEGGLILLQDIILAN